MPSVGPTVGMVKEFSSSVTRAPANITPMIALTIGREAMNTDRNTNNNSTSATARPISSA